MNEESPNTSTEKLLPCSNIDTLTADHIFCPECRREFMTFDSKHYCNPLAKCDEPKLITVEKYHELHEYLRCNWADAKLELINDRLYPVESIRLRGRDVTPDDIDGPEEDENRVSYLCDDCDVRIHLKPKPVKTKCPRCEYVGYYVRISADDKTCPACVAFDKNKECEEMRKREKQEAREAAREKARIEKEAAKKENAEKEAEAVPKLEKAGDELTELLGHAIIESYIGAEVVEKTALKPAFYLFIDMKFANGSVLANPKFNRCTKVEIVGLLMEGGLDFVAQFNWSHQGQLFGVDDFPDRLQKWLQEVEKIGPYAWKVDEFHWRWLRHLCKFNLGLRFD